MSDLEPITREEAAWINEGELTPITRKEQYIKHLYDETQVVPEKPLTREEWFINKAGEELHDVTIEQLNVSENGTYSETGKAYNPVVVNVPQNGYVMKNLTAGAVATITDAQNIVMPALAIDIEPVQEGSGDPSPENVRPIHGWTEMNVTVTDGDETTKTVTIPFVDNEGTEHEIYGGYLNVETGVLVVTDLKRKLNDLIVDESKVSKVSPNANPYFRISTISVARYGILCDKIPSTPLITSQTTDIGISVVKPSGTNQYMVCARPPQAEDMSVSDFIDWVNAMGDVYIVAGRTATYIYIKPTAIKTMLGNNQISADTGDIRSGKYWAINEISQNQLNTLRSAGEITEITPEEPEETEENADER